MLLQPVGQRPTHVQHMALGDVTPGHDVTPGAVGYLTLEI
jgi:hypothetical protein